MIEVRGLTKRFSSRVAVDNLEFEVRRGETVGFLGPNGAGKSTTMRLLTGFLAPSAGSVRVAGHDVEADPLAARRAFGYLPESNPLPRDQRVREFLEYRARLKGIERGRRRAAIGEVLERCRVDGVRERIIGQLSKGYRQRVGLADALLGRPPLLILDEPTVGLDPNQVVETRRLIREIGRECTVFLSTHILHEVEWLCPRVLIIDRGRLVAEGQTAELARRHVQRRRLSFECVAPAGGATGEAFGEEAKKALRRLAGVGKAVYEGLTPEGAHAFTLTAPAESLEGEGDLRRRVASLANESGWLIQEMRLEPLRLEELFAQLTGHRPAADTNGDARCVMPDAQ